MGEDPFIANQCHGLILCTAVEPSVACGSVELFRFFDHDVLKVEKDCAVQPQPSMHDGTVNCATRITHVSTIRNLTASIALEARRS